MSVWDRAGTAYEQGAPAGASVNIGQTTRTTTQAGAAGRMFSGGTMFAATNAVQAGPLIQTLKEEQPAGNGASWMSTALRYLAWPSTQVANYVKNNIRYVSQNKTGNWWIDAPATAATLTTPIGVLDESWRSGWADAQNGSVAQTLERALNNAEVGAAGDFSLLDNPARAEEYANYYNAGTMRFATGALDAAFTLVADPLNLLGVGQAAIKAGRTVLNAADVVAVADRTLDTASLTSRQQRARQVWESVVDATEPDAMTDGTIAALSRTQLFAQTTDSGAIPYLMGRANQMAEFADNAALRREFKWDLLSAGAGDQAALARIGERSETLAAEVFNLGQQIDDYRNALRLSTAARPDVESVYAQTYAEMVQDPAWLRSTEAQMAEVNRTFEGLARVRNIGNPADTITQGVGGLGTVPKTAASMGREVLKQQRVIQQGRFLHPINVLTGLHVPQTFRLSADDAPRVFDAALRRASGVLDPQTAAQLRDEFASAVSYGQITKVDRAAVLQRFNRAVEEGLAAKHGKTVEEMAGFMLDARMRRSAELRALYSRVYQAHQPGGAVLHRTDDATVALSDAAAQEIKKSGGVLDLDRPVLASQMEDWVSLLDVKSIDTYLSKRFREGGLGVVQRGADGVWHVTDTVLSSANRLWKFSALFRLSYPLRVQVDSQARLMASLGPMRYAAMAMHGVDNWRFNKLTRVDQGVLRDFERRFNLARELDDVERDIAAFAGGGNLDELVTRAANLKSQLDAKTPVKLTGTKVSVRGSEMQRFLGKRDLRKNRLTGGADSAYQSIDEMRDTMSRMDARANIIGLFSDGEGQALRQIRGSGNWDLIAGAHPQWADSFLRSVNRQIRNDDVAMMMVAGESDDAILRWVNGTPEGRAYWRTMAPQWSGAGQDAWLTATRQHVDTLLPDDAARSLVARDNLTRDDLIEMWPVPADRPSVPSEIMAPVPHWADNAGTLIGAARDRWFRFANDVPENMMARHPLYQESFRSRMRDLIAKSGSETTLSVAQMNALKAQASTLARRDIGEILFDTSRSTNLGYHMRYMSPFFAAWQDTMTKWGAIMGNNLTVPVAAMKVFAAPNAAGLVFDKDGRLINKYGEVVDYRRDTDGEWVGTGEVVGAANIFNAGMIVIPAPPWVENVSGQSDFVISKESLNIIFQGDPFWLPGPGPMLTIPVNQAMVETFPELGPKFAGSPLGLYLTAGFGLTDDSVIDQAMPQWVKNLRTAVSQDQGEARFSQAYVLEYQSLLAEVSDGTREPMEPDALQELAATRTRNKFILQFLGSYVPPASTRTQNRFQFYVDTYREYQRQFGLDAYQEFVKDYPEYAELAISLSANETGVNATVEAWDSVQGYKDLIARNPEFGWAVAGADNLTGDFNSDVYTLQRGTPIGAGTDATWRSSRDPMESIRQNAIQQGWHEYWQISSQLNDAAAAAGLSSVSADAGLAEIKRQALESLASQNPTWYDSYTAEGAGDSAVRFMSWAAQTVTDYPELGERSDFQSLYEYMDARQQMQQALGALFGDNAPHSIYSQTARDAGLTAIWEAFTLELARSDAGFEQMWTTARLEADDLTGVVNDG